MMRHLQAARPACQVDDKDLDAALQRARQMTDLLNEALQQHGLGYEEAAALKEIKNHVSMMEHQVREVKCARDPDTRVELINGVDPRRRSLIAVVRQHEPRVQLSHAAVQEVLEWCALPDDDARRGGGGGGGYAASGRSSPDPLSPSMCSEEEGDFGGGRSPSLNAGPAFGRAAGATPGSGGRWGHSAHSGGGGAMRSPHSSAASLSLTSGWDGGGSKGRAAPRSADKGAAAVSGGGDASPTKSPDRRARGAAAGASSVPSLGLDQLPAAAARRGSLVDAEESLACDQAPPPAADATAATATAAAAAATPAWRGGAGAQAAPATPASPVSARSGGGRGRPHVPFLRLGAADADDVSLSSASHGTGSGSGSHCAGLPLFAAARSSAAYAGSAGEAAAAADSQHQHQQQQPYAARYGSTRGALGDDDAGDLLLLPAPACATPPRARAAAVGAAAAAAAAARLSGGGSQQHQHHQQQQAPALLPTSRDVSLGLRVSAVSSVEEAALLSSVSARVHVIRDAAPQKPRRRRPGAESVRVVPSCLAVSRRRPLWARAVGAAVAAVRAAALVGISVGAVAAAARLKPAPRRDANRAYAPLGDAPLASAACG